MLDGTAHLGVSIRYFLMGPQRETQGLKVVVLLLEMKMGNSIGAMEIPIGKKKKTHRRS